ncbi:unnamed protein product [Phytomonas sp. EM1]|nr:unnamed protein product [Phytomonas sp. EM1]|eukprot:CCW64858.1 unnamed protein product [Phytomonas sp. isolate EM1]
MSTVPTLFIRCPAIPSRHVLVNRFLFDLRAELGIAEWFTEDSVLRSDAPVEVVYAATSRKPYFLVEFRPPTPEEWRRRKPPLSNALTSSETQGDCGEFSSEKKELARRCADRLLDGSPRVFNGHPVVISTAAPGITVATTRVKREGGGGGRRGENSTRSPPHELNEKGGKPTPISFTPRAVKKRRAE